MKIYAVEYLTAWGAPLGIWCYKMSEKAAKEKATELVKEKLAVWAVASEKKVED